MLEKIQELCKLRGITLSGLERELDFSRGSMYKWEKNSPSIDKVQKVADYFDVSTDYLLERSTLKYPFIYDEYFEKDMDDYMGRLADYLFDSAKKNTLTAKEKEIGIKFNEIVMSMGDFLYFSRMDAMHRENIIDLLAAEVNQRTHQIVPVIKLRDFSSTFIKEEIDNKSYTSYLSAKDERDIARDLAQMLSSLESNEALAFDGEPLDDETKELMRISLENSMRLAKQIAKKKFTPKKYR